ncbi:MAG: Phosphatidylglycerol--prolipoprotein diacylglyceryl transferase [Bacteroidetes bacterium]|nr:Phosphatidylglycerol--prolipoprotein diacylglyceryl transferase [Bacteroidota bacterium]
MIPVLFEIGPLRINSFGLMLGIGFILGSYILSLELKRKKLDPSLASNITIIAVIFGIGGAKLLHVIEHVFEYWGTPHLDIKGQLFSFSGLTWYGGLILGMVAISVYVHRKRIPFLKIWDGLGVALILAYGVARLGCHFAGDGDYGIPTRLPWGTIYANGTAKPTSMLEDYFDRHPYERVTWSYDSLRVIHSRVDRLGYPINRFDEVTPLHPTPVYEMILGVVGFLIMLKLRKNDYPDGKLFMIYLILSSMFRFSVEFLRLQPKLLFGLSEAQLLAIALFVTGLVGMKYLDRKSKGTQSA